MPRPLPFDELLAALKDGGLPIGLREHLLVGRLLDRWPGAELASLRSALAALLARNPEEVALVRATFDALYGERPEDPPPPPPPPPPLPEPRRRWGRVAGIIVATLLIASSLGYETPPSVEVPSAPEAKERPVNAPEPPTIPDEILEIPEASRPDLVRALTIAGGLSTFLFLRLYGGRIRREARRLGRSRWRREADALPRPYRYQPDLSDLAAPFPATVLDEAAQILGRRAPAPPRPYDLDIDRTLQSTLEAGLAPEVVLREQLTTPMLLILEDTGGEMQPWRRTVRALLTGLAARGVPFDLWHFQADAHRVFRTPGGVTMTLERLARLHGSIPVLVISAGEGVLQGREERLSPWVGLLSSWPRRAWLHPVPDSGYWRPALREAPVDVFPLTPGGVLMAARRLAGINAPPRSTAPVFPHRPVTPLDVDRLRWLLTLVPGRNPDLAERLRQQIFPSTSPAALVEALESTPLRTPPPLAPPAEAVHTALADLIANTPPPPGSAAYERWRLDVALQEIHVPERQGRALEELQNLARGPLATEVERAVGRLPLTLQRPLRRSLENRAEKDGRAVARVEGPPRPHWRRPDLVELGSTLVCLLLLFWGLQWVFTRPERVEVVERYTLELNDFGPAGLHLLAARTGQAPMLAKLYRGNSLRSDVVFNGNEATIPLDSGDRGYWYYLRAPFEENREKKLAISNRVWVPQQGELPIENEPMGTDLGASEPMGTDMGGFEPLGTDMGTTEPMGTDIEPPGGGTEPTTPPGTVGGTGEPSRSDPAPAEPLATDLRTFDDPLELPPVLYGSLEIINFPEEKPPSALVLRSLDGKSTYWKGENPISLPIGTYTLSLEDDGEGVSRPVTVDILHKQNTSVRINGSSIERIQDDLTRAIEEELTPKIERVSPVYERTGELIALSIRGANFEPNAYVEVPTPGGEGIQLECRVTQPTEIECTVGLSRSMPRGRWDLTVTNPGGRSATQTGAIVISGE